MANTDKFLDVFLFARTQIHVWHLQTKSYAQHIALGDLYEKFGEFTDGIAEKLMGTRGGERLNVSPFPDLEIENYSNAKNIADFLYYLLDYVEDLQEELDEWTEIVNDLDNVKSCIDKVIYLLTLD